MTSEPSGGTPAPAAATPSSRRRLPAPVREQVSSANQDGWLMAVELVTATFTWGGIGYLIDRFWLGTYPVFMSIGFVIGFFAGMYLLWLKTSKPAAAHAAEDGVAPDPTGGSRGVSP